MPLLLEQKESLQEQKYPLLTSSIHPVARVLFWSTLPRSPFVTDQSRSIVEPLVANTKDELLSQWQQELGTISGWSRSLSASNHYLYPFIHPHDTAMFDNGEHGPLAMRLIYPEKEEKEFAKDLRFGSLLELRVEQFAVWLSSVPFSSFSYLQDLALTIAEYVGSDDTVLFPDVKVMKSCQNRQLAKQHYPFLENLFPDLRGLA